MKIFDVIANFVFAIVASYSPREERYHKPIPTIIVKHGFRINQTHLAKVLAIKYEQFKLTDEGEFKKSDRRWTKEELELQNKKS